MSDISTTYLGLHLGSPIIVSSSSLTKTVNQVERCEAAGAGAVVLKSLFEEQIEHEIEEERGSLAEGIHTEALDYLVAELHKDYAPGYYLDLIAESRKKVEIPIIASINCIRPEWWVRFARKVEAAGAHAIELNISLLPSSFEQQSTQIEETYLEIVREVKKEVRIPVAIKLGPYFTSLPHFSWRLCQEGADALVFFNRFYHIDIDIENLKLNTGNIYSSPEEMNWSLRWIALLYEKLPCELVANTGLHDASGIIKQLLAGATAVELASVLYKRSVEYISQLNRDLRDWMELKGFVSLKQFRGLLSQARSSQPEVFERIQYIKALVGIE